MLSEYPTAARPNCDPRRSFTAEACDGLDSIVSAIEEKLGPLEQRLQPVIVPIPMNGAVKQAGVPNAQQEPNALARRLQIIAGRLQTADDRLLNILQTLDL